jgi:hypothetical protein
MITVEILADIERPSYRHPFYARCSRIVYDAKSPRAKKIHQLLYQQGPRYGQIGDACDYVRHDELLEMERRGLVRIVGPVKR